MKRSPFFWFILWRFRRVGYFAALCVMASLAELPWQAITALLLLFIFGSRYVDK